MDIWLLLTSAVLFCLTLSKIGDVGNYEITMLKSMLVNKDFQTWHLIG